VDHVISNAVEKTVKARIFISYSRKDIAFADRLDAGLKARRERNRLLPPASLAL